jgi:hypothetical protein
MLLRLVEHHGSGHEAERQYRAWASYVERRVPGAEQGIGEGRDRDRRGEFFFLRLLKKSGSSF